MYVYSEKSENFCETSTVLCSNGQIYGGDFEKNCGFLRIYELYRLKSSGRTNPKTSVQFFKVVFLSSSKNTEEDFHFLNLLLIYFYCRSLSLIGFDAPF